MTDARELRALIDAERPSIVVPEIEAIATDVLIEIEGLGVARVIPSARAAHLTTNREGIDASPQKRSNCRPRGTVRILFIRASCSHAGDRAALHRQTSDVVFRQRAEPRRSTLRGAAPALGAVLRWVA